MTGEKCRMLNVIDEFTHEYLAIRISIKGVGAIIIQR